MDFSPDPFAPARPPRSQRADPNRPRLSRDSSALMFMTDVLAFIAYSTARAGPPRLR
jgi:hypothetical protein